MTERVRVAVRVRPLNGREREAGTRNVVRCVSPKELEITCPSAGGVSAVKKWSFDVCADGGQADVFEGMGCRALLDSALRGVKATCFAYGATGSGKTHTVVGELVDDSSGGLRRGPEDVGLIEHGARYLFEKASPKLSVIASFYEVYNENVFDLLDAGKTPLPVRHNADDKNIGFFVPGLSELECESAEDVTAVVAEGRLNRRRAAHKLNRDSSRGHALLTLRLVHGATRGKVTFVDLAGNERLKRSEDSDAAETGAINKSLHALGKVISALGTGSKGGDHVPYRDSTLTKLLQDSLGGDATTLMVACVSPAAAHVDETLCTLAYAYRAAGILNAPVVNLVGVPSGAAGDRAREDAANAAEVEALRSEVARLKDANRRLTADNRAFARAAADVKIGRAHV